jgi:hypothetical protein
MRPTLDEQVSWFAYLPNDVAEGRARLIVIDAEIGHGA